MNTGETVGFVMENALLVPTVAEGVETAEQLNALRSMGCDIAQGYYFSKPVPPSSTSSLSSSGCALRRRSTP